MDIDFEREDLEDMKRVVNSENFIHFLLNHTTSFRAAAVILQTLSDKVMELEEHTVKSIQQVVMLGPKQKILVQEVKVPF